MPIRVAKTEWSGGLTDGSGKTELPKTNTCRGEQAHVSCLYHRPIVFGWMPTSPL